MNFEPSPYQIAILDWLRNDKGNATIIATAGSGKTSTLCLIAENLPANSTAIFLAFNKAIATELSARLPFPASTFHSLAFKAVRRAIMAKTRTAPTVDAQKTNNLIDTRYGKGIDDVRPAITRLVGLAKNENHTPNLTNDDVIALVDRHDIDWDTPEFTINDVCDIVRTILADSLANLRTVDFDDMLWLVSQLNVKIDTYDFVLVDESQDTNTVQRDLLRRCMHNGSRLIAVGDHAQAIYGFRGASSDALALIQSEFSAVELPLTVSYRCPSNVVKLASRYGRIEAAPNAPNGTVKTLETFKLTELLPTDLVVCRNTAPLVSLAYKCIANRIPAVIKGRDIGNGLKSLIKKLSGRSNDLTRLADRLEAYRTTEVQKALDKRQEGKAQSIDDKCTSIMALIDTMTEDDTTRGVTGLLAIIDSMFSDNAERGKVLLSTIHKSKGLEYPRVIILDWALCPSKMARQDWQRKQETNLQFVAITRSKDTLLFVDSETIVSE